MKVSKTINHVVGVGTLAAVGFGLLGCGLTEPKESAAKANQLPDTEITAGPRENGVSSYFVQLYWKGEDLDGTVESYILTVDGQTTTVTRRDSTFKFSAANQDEQHTVSVAAVDDAGGVDPEPATLTFTATNVPPNTEIMIEGNPAQGATFGLGAVFTIVAVDDPDNGPEFSYRYKIDDNGTWSEWQETGTFEFSQTSEFGLLPEGQHTFIAQVRDNGLAVDETPARFRVVVSKDVKPVVALQSTIHGAPFYQDSTAFSYPQGNSLAFSWSATFTYAGAVSAGSRYRIDGGAWTEYSKDISATALDNVSAGRHSIEVQAQDIGGLVSDVALFSYQIIEAPMNQGILVVDDGDGQFGRNDNVDMFYQDVLTALGIQPTMWDIRTNGALTPGKGIGNYSTVIWQSDEAFFREFPKHIQLMSQYLTLSGNLWISGWKTLQNISGSVNTNIDHSPDNVTSRPPNADFTYGFLKIHSSNQAAAAPPDYTGSIGQAGHPDLNVDAAKNFVPAFQNRLGYAEIMTPRSEVAEAQGIYTFVSSTGNPTFQGNLSGVKYLGSDYKVAVFGFPFYFANNDEAIAAARVILTDFGEL